MPGPVTFLAVGSRGDVEPLAVLAGAVAASGRPATVVAVDEYADLVHGHGAGFRGLGHAIAEVERLGRGWLGRLALRTAIAQPALLARWLKGLAEPLADALAEVPSGSLVVSGVAARDAALALVEQRGCQMATVLHTAVLPTAHRQSHLEGRRLSGVSSVDLALTRWYWAQVSGLSRVTAAEFRRRHRLRRHGNGRLTAAADEHPIWLAADPVLVPPAGDWPGTVRQIGAIRPPEADWAPSDPLAAFLTAGEPPTYVGLGSLNDSGGIRWLELIVAAARLSGRRIVTPALPGTEPQVIENLVCTTGPVPHDELFPRLAGVIHHGGAGSAAAGLRAGVPSLAVPAMFDQTYHARRLFELGVGPRPVPLPRVTSARLAARLGELTGEEYVEPAARVGVAARTVDGTAAALREISALG